MISARVSITSFKDLKDFGAWADTSIEEGVPKLPPADVVLLDIRLPEIRD
jgi:hypothetical protein